MGGMGRGRRVDEPGAWHHVTNRGVNGDPIFVDRADRVKFLALLAEIAPRYGIEVHCHCLMGNHFHLQLRSTSGLISDAMRDLAGRYARYFNRRHNRYGPLFAGRFRSRLITSDTQWLATWLYIVRNPAEFGYVAPVDYEWSSARVYAGLVPAPQWLHTGFVAAIVGADETCRLMRMPAPT